MQAGAIRPGQSVLIIDDLLATGMQIEHTLSIRVHLLIIAYRRLC